jgi:hypothetical protein
MTGNVIDKGLTPFGTLPSPAPAKRREAFMNNKKTGRDCYTLWDPTCLGDLFTNNLHIRYLIMNLCIRSTIDPYFPVTCS